MNSKYRQKTAAAAQTACLAFYENLLWISNKNNKCIFWIQCPRFKIKKHIVWGRWSTVPLSTLEQFPLLPPPPFKPTIQVDFNPNHPGPCVFPKRMAAAIVGTCYSRCTYFHFSYVIFFSVWVREVVIAEQEGFSPELFHNKSSVYTVYSIP